MSSSFAPCDTSFTSKLHRKCVQVFVNTPPSVLLRRAAELITERGWMCANCRSTHVHSGELDVTSAIMAAAGWVSIWRGQESRMPRQSYVERDANEMGMLIAHMLSQRASRVGFTRTMDSLAEIIKLEDIAMWNDEYCHDADEAIDALTRAAELAESRGY